MLVNTVSYLLFIGILSLIRFKHRLDRIAAPLITAATVAVFYFFCLDMRIGAEAITTLVWDSSRSGDIKIDIVSSVNNYRLIFPFFVITILALVNNLFFRYEQNKKSFSAILVLNLLSLIMLITGNNLLQIITFVFVTDILSQLLIKDIYASRRYSIYNLIADMGLFLVMAMLKGKLETLEVTNMVHYYETGRHRDFIMFVIIISLFIKFGFFLFQSYLLDLKNTKFHRLILIPYLSTPMVALILFMKFYPLLVVSPSFDMCLNIAVVLTMVWGAIGTIVINNLKEKTVYLNMLIIALLVKSVQNADFIWGAHFSLMLIFGFCINLCLYYAHYSVNRENNLHLIDSNKYVNRSLLNFDVFAYVLVSLAFLSQIAKINNNDQYWIYLFTVLFVVASSHLYSQLFVITRHQTKMPVLSYSPFVVLLLCITIASFEIGKCKTFWISSLVFCAIYLILIKLYPLRFIYQNSYLNTKLQKIDFSAHVYDIIIVRPVKIMGRLLTVLFDFIFIEKTLTAMLSSINAFTIRVFRKSVRHWKTYYFFNFILAVAVLIWCFIKENK